MKPVCGRVLTAVAFDGSNVAFDGSKLEKNKLNMKFLLKIELKRCCKTYIWVKILAGGHVCGGILVWFRRDGCICRNYRMNTRIVP